MFEDIQLPIILADGVVFAAWLFLIAAGMTLIFGVLRILNIAHGALYAIGAYVGAMMVAWWFDNDYWELGSLGLLIVAAVLASVVVGPILERGVLRWMYRRDEILQLLVTYALFLILEDLIKLVWGKDTIYAYEPFTLLGFTRVGGIIYQWYQFLIVGLAIVAGIGLWLFINRTRFGRFIIAVIHDPEMATSMGINLTAIYVATFTIGTFLAALAGAVNSPIQPPQPGIGANTVVLAFAVVVIGGLGSLPGAAIGALLVGLVRSFAVHQIPEFELFVIYIVMAGVLIFRPNGLFAQEEARKI